MPTVTYMGVDARRDHSFRLPRPLLEANTGSADACRSCHRDQTASWAQKARSEEHTSELQSLMRISYAVFCLKKKKYEKPHQSKHSTTTTVTSRNTSLTYTKTQ